MKLKKDIKIGYGIKIFPKAEYGKTYVPDNALYLLPRRAGGGVISHGYETIEEAKAGMEDYVKGNRIKDIRNIGNINVIKITIQIEEELVEKIDT